MISFDDFKKIFDLCAGEPEFELLFSGTDKTYMIIKYDDHVSFQRCGTNDGSVEYDYTSLQELYSAELIDGLCLKNMWNDIAYIIANGTFELTDRDEREDFIKLMC